MSSYLEKFREALKGWSDNDIRRLLNIDKRVQELEDSVKELRELRELQADPNIIKAKEWANDAITKASRIVEVMQSAATTLKNDTENIKNRAIELRDIINQERNNIKNAFVNYGRNLGNSALEVRNMTYAVAHELKDARDEITVPMAKVKEYIDLLYRDRYRPILVAYNAYMALAHLTYKSGGGEQSVIREIIEAFDQINNAFKNFGDSFNNFGHITYNASIELSNIINNSMRRINEATMNFILAFNKLGINLYNVFAEFING